MNQNLLILDTLLRHSNSADLLNQHHLQGMIYHEFKIEDEQNKNQYKKQWIHNSVLLEELRNIAQIAHSLDLAGTLLKGAHLLLDLYPDLGSRFLSDVDLLIDEKDYLNWEKLLIGAGFRTIEIPLFFGNNFKSQWVKLHGEIEINLELHSKLFFHLKREMWTYKESAISPFKQLSLEDTFIHLCGHLAFQHTFLKLYWLFDIYFYVNKFGDRMDWEDIKIKSKANHLQQSVIMCLWCLHKYFSLETSIVQSFKLDEVKWWQKYLTVAFLLYPDDKKTNYFLIKHATKDQFIEALWYDLTWIWHYKIQKKLLRQ